MDIIVELLNVVVTLGVIVAIAIGMAALFIIVLSLATGIDSNIRTDDERS